MNSQIFYITIGIFFCRSGFAYPLVVTFFFVGVGGYLLSLWFFLLKNQSRERVHTLTIHYKYSFDYLLCGEKMAKLPNTIYKLALALANEQAYDQIRTGTYDPKEYNEHPYLSWDDWTDVFTDNGYGEKGIKTWCKTWSNKEKIEILYKGTKRGGAPIPVGVVFIGEELGIDAKVQLLTRKNNNLREKYCDAKRTIAELGQ